LECPGGQVEKRTEYYWRKRGPGNETRKNEEPNEMKIQEKGSKGEKVKQRKSG